MVYGSVDIPVYCPYWASNLVPAGLDLTCIDVSGMSGHAATDRRQ